MGFKFPPGYYIQPMKRKDEMEMFDRCTCCGGGFDGNMDCPEYCEGRVIDGKCEFHSEPSDERKDEMDLYKSAEATLLEALIKEKEESGDVHQFENGDFATFTLLEGPFEGHSYGSFWMMEYADSEGPFLIQTFDSYDEMRHWTKEFNNRRVEAEKLNAEFYDENDPVDENYGSETARPNLRIVRD